MVDGTTRANKIGRGRMCVREGCAKRWWMEREERERTVKKEIFVSNGEGEAPTLVSSLNTKT